MAGSILSDTSDVVTCGLASAPVVSWRWYCKYPHRNELGVQLQLMLYPIINGPLFDIFRR